jgi:adenylate cyclase
VTQSAEVFVSYSRGDQDRVFELAAKLRAAGVSLWIDQGAIDAASLWSEQIVNALESAKALLLIVTPTSVHSDNVAKEVMLVSERKGHILPVHLEPTVIPPTLKYQLAGIQHIEYFKAGDTESSVKAILRSLERLGVTVAPPSETRVTAGAAQPEAATGARRIPSAERGALAVVPFDNISPDPETDYFGDGLTEELTARLSTLSEIELVSRWAIKQLKERKHEVHDIGSHLGARYIVGGSVRRFQDSVRITVQLVDVQTNRQLWATPTRASSMTSLISRNRWRSRSSRL